MADSIRFCPKCKLPQRPDPRIYKGAGERCHRCGFRFEDADKWKEKDHGKNESGKPIYR